MAKTINYYCRHEFETEKEEKSAQILTLGNIQFIENQLFSERNRKENLTLDPTNVVAFVQEEAECKGAILALQFLLDRHNDVIQSMNPESPTALQS